MVLGHNEFSDMTQEEFHQMFKLGAYAEQKPLMMESAASVDREVFDSMVPLDLPDYINWVQMGGVTDVKNQGSCKWSAEEFS